MTISAESEHVESDGDESGNSGVSVESEHVENLTSETFARELVRVVAENEDLSKKHVATRDTILLNMQNLPVDGSDFE